MKYADARDLIDSGDVLCIETRTLGANLGVTTDLLGAARDATPHAGCYETA